MHARKTVCGDEFATYLPPRFSVTEQTKTDRSIGNQQKSFQSSNESEKQTDGSKKSSKKHIIVTHKTHYCYT